MICGISFFLMKDVYYEPVWFFQKIFLRLFSTDKKASSFAFYIHLFNVYKTLFSPDICFFFWKHFKVNPLVRWTPEDVSAYREAHDLPAHPLVEQGYPSIGCWPCTKPAEDPNDIRSGRWAGQDKSECGLHIEKAERPRVF